MFCQQFAFAHHHVIHLIDIEDDAKSLIAAAEDDIVHVLGQFAIAGFRQKGEDEIIESPMTFRLQPAIRLVAGTGALPEDFFAVPHDRAFGQRAILPRTWRGNDRPA